MEAHASRGERWVGELFDWFSQRGYAAVDPETDRSRGCRFGDEWRLERRVRCLTRWVMEGPYPIASSTPAAKSPRRSAPSATR
jgi:hypothetical protein